MISKELFSKPRTEWTEAEESEVKEAVLAYNQDILEVCKKHGLQHSAVLETTPNGIKPAFNIIPYEDAA
jgi:hypothetical protein